MDSQALIWNHILAAVNSLVLKCAIKLDIFDILGRHARPLTLPALVTSLPVQCTNPSTLRRIMRYLARMHLVHELADGSYALAPAAKLLMKGEEAGLAHFALLFLEEDYLAAMHKLEACLVGEPTVSGYEKVMGESVWAHASRHPGHNQMFNKAMAGRAKMAVAGVIGACREVFDGVRTAVDVGGGTGTAAREIVRAFPHVECTVLDLPHVVRGLEQSPGVEYAEGDMFEFVPPADVIILMEREGLPYGAFITGHAAGDERVALLSGILHDWDDDHCLKILMRCKEAIAETRGKLIIVDAVIGAEDEDDNELSNARMATDIVMMVYTGGKERTEKDWKELLARAGLGLCKITPTMTIQHVIEARPPTI